MLALRAKPPVEIEKRLKLLMFGESGVGKTTAALQMPKPYVIDCEHGTDHYGRLIEESGGAVFHTTVMAEVTGELRSLISEEHGYRSLVIDPITPCYQDLLDQCEKQVGSEFGKHYGEAAKVMKRMANLIMALDQNVVITAHSKNLYGENLRVLGQTFDGWKRLDYLFDLVLCLERRGKNRVARIVKTRLAGFPDGDEFEWSYDAIADRYGRQILERQAHRVELATEDQVQRFRTLLTQLSESEQNRLGITRALRDVEGIADLPVERIIKGIEVIESHLGQPTTRKDN